jgi:ketosteroid isomerase-like protein
MTDTIKVLIGDLYAARARGDLGAIADCFTVDATWRYPGKNPLAGEYRGRKGVTSFFRKLRELTNDSFETKACHVLIDGDVAVVHEGPTGVRNGRALGWDTLLLLRIRDDRIAEGKVFQHLQHELDEFWS